MTKYIINKITIIALALLMVSCADDILKEESTINTPTDSYFQSFNDLDAVVTATYKQLVTAAWGTGMGSARSRTVFMGADDFTSQATGNKGDFKESDLLNISPSNTGISSTGWDMPYRVIQQANFAIAGQQILLSNSENSTEINSRAAEAYTLRAWAYFRLVRLYGDLPLVLDYRYSPATSSLSRSSVSDVYTQILSDLEFAIEHLPEIQTERARLSKWAAKAIRSKVYLTMAGWPLKQTENYAKALSDAEDILNNGPFEFESTFSDIFKEAREDSNTEYIWQLKFCNEVDCPGSGLFHVFALRPQKPNFIGGFGDLFVEKAFYNKYPEGSRKDFTFLSQVIDATEGVKTWENFDVKHPFLSKFYDTYFNKNIAWQSQENILPAMVGIDFPLFRITEIMLIYSEAHVMGGGGNATTALNYLNMVKRRGKGVAVNTADADDATSLTQQAIIDERGWEFIGEMKRWFDLTRTETLASALADRDEPSDMTLLGSPSDKNRYYLPVPALEIQYNPNLEPQNPGY